MNNVWIVHMEKVVQEIVRDEGYRYNLSMHQDILGQRSGHLWLQKQRDKEHRKVVSGYCI